MQGKHEVLLMDLCTVLLMDDTNYLCWLVLVPQRKDIKVCAKRLLPLQQRPVLLSCRESVHWKPHRLVRCVWLLQHAMCGAQEVIDLSDKDQRKLWEEVSHVCRAVRSSFEPGLKLNIAAIGNVVRNFALHPNV